MAVGQHKNPGNETLYVRKSRIPGAGKGLFTRAVISQDEIILEYKGAITTYKKVQAYTEKSPYVYYVNRNYVIDARDYPESLGRYANDAEGECRHPGLTNNSQFIVLNKKVYLQALCDIAAGAEILVSYGKGYWEVVRFNKAIERAMKKNKQHKVNKAKT